MTSIVLSYGLMFAFIGSGFYAVLLAPNDYQRVLIGFASIAVLLLIVAITDAAL